MSETSVVAEADLWLDGLLQRGFATKFMQLVALQAADLKDGVFLGGRPLANGMQNMLESEWDLRYEAQAQTPPSWLLYKA